GLRFNSLTRSCASPVAISTIILASWFGSRGRFAMSQVCHNADSLFMRVKFKLRHYRRLESFLQFLFQDRVILSASPPHCVPLQNRVCARTLTWVLPRGGHHEPYPAQYLDRDWRSHRHPDHCALLHSGESLPPDHRRKGIRGLGSQSAGGRPES